MEMAESIKRLAQQQVDGTYPTVLLFGTISNTNPLTLKIDNKVYSSEFIVIPRHLTNYEVTIEESTSQGYVERNVKVKSELKQGDKVIVARQQGGQKYIVLDRIGG